MKTTCLENKAKIFKALGHPTRLKIVYLLLHDELCVCRLLTEMKGEANGSTLSRHLSILREAGVLTSRKEGQNIHYRLKLSCVANFLECLTAKDCECV